MAIPGTQTARVGDDVVVHDPARAVTHVLNASAGLVWSCVDGASDVDGIVARVASAVGVSIGAVDADVRRTIAAFEAVGLVGLVGRVGPVGPREEPAVAPAGAVPDPHDERRATRIRSHLRDVVWAGTTGPRQVGGTTIEIRTDDPQLAELVIDVSSSLPAVPSAAHRISILDRGEQHIGRFRLLVDERPFARLPTREQAAEAVFIEVNRRAVIETRDRLLLHAGAVERDGGVIVVAGESGRGKSTLTAALVQRGFAYLTDELVAIEPGTRQVDPFPKALSLDDAALQVLGLPPPHVPVALPFNMISPSRLGAVSTGGRPALIVLLRAEDEVGIGGERAADHLVELLRNTFAATWEVPDALDALADLCVSVPVLRLDRVDIEQAVAVVVAAFEGIGW